MTPAEQIEKAFNDAHLVIAEYIRPGAQNAEKTVDNPEFYEAVVCTLMAERGEVTLVPC
jgi:hypothetical protein